MLSLFRRKGKVGADDPIISGPGEETEPIEAEISKLLESGRATHADIAGALERLKTVGKEREQFFKFFTLSTEIMVIADPNGNFKKVNPACLRILGYAEKELLEKPFIDFVHPDDKQATLDEMARQIKLGSSMNFENRYRCKDGSVLWLAWNASYDKHDNTTYATARDITERKESEKKERAYTSELKEMNALMIDRELKMIEMKKEHEKLTKLLEQQA